METSREAEKRALADAPLDREDGALSVQVLQEFHVQATGPSRPGRLPHDLAVGLVRAWTHGREVIGVAIVNPFR